GLVLGATGKGVVPGLRFPAAAPAGGHGGSANHGLHPAGGDGCHLSTGRAERRGAGGARSDPANRQTAPPLKPRLAAFWWVSCFCCRSEASVGGRCLTSV